MGIFQGSRYEYSVIDFVAVDTDADANAVVFYEKDDIGLLAYVEHTYTQGERLDVIANKYYRRPDLWWIILDANPQINDPLSIKPGTVLRIPNV